MEIEKIIDSVINIDKTELKKQVEIWKEQRFKTKSNEEFFLILNRLELAKKLLFNHE